MIWTAIVIYAAMAAATYFVLDIAWTHAQRGPQTHRAPYGLVILWASLWPACWLRTAWSFVR